MDKPMNKRRSWDEWEILILKWMIYIIVAASPIVASHVIAYWLVFGF